VEFRVESASEPESLARERDAGRTASHTQRERGQANDRPRTIGSTVASTGASIRELTVPFLGPERSRWLYPIASLAKSGAPLAAGSDWSVTSMNPLEAIEVALTRRDPTARPGLAWIPEERADLATLLAAYTIGGAWTAFRERESGSIEVGKRGDLIVLEKNLFDLLAHEIPETRVLRTYFEGREVYRMGPSAPE
jgi:predicted amidohydrolase YtcJ